MAKKITDLMSKEAQKVKPNDKLICCYCDEEFIAKNGYDYSFCCENCCEEQELLNESNENDYGSFLGGNNFSETYFDDYIFERGNFFRKKK